MSASGDVPPERRSASSRWRMVIVCGLLGLAIGFGWGIADQPVYRATASVVVESDSKGADTARLERFAQRGESQGVATLAASVLGGDVAGADLLSDVSVRPSPRGGAVIVTATSESPDLAAAAAAAFAEALVGIEGDPLAIGAAAEIPSEPIENRPAALAAAIGLLAGVLLGSLAAFALSRFGRTDVAVEDGEPDREPAVDRWGDGDEPGRAPDPATVLATALDTSVIGHLADAEGAIGSGSSGMIGVGDEVMASMRSIFLGLEIGPEAAVSSIVVTEVRGAGDVASFCAGLSVAAAEAGHRVILVEADLAAPDLARRLGISPAPGLHEYLVGKASPREVLRTVMAEVFEVDGGSVSTVGFACVPAGLHGREAVVAGSAFDQLIDRLTRVYDLVICAAPPVFDGGETAAIAAASDGVVVVVDGDASRDDLDLAEDQLAVADALGVVSAQR